MNAETATINILLVEDNLGDILLIREGLKYAKVAAMLSVARDGEEALRFLKKQDNFADAPTPDIILLDLNLPRLDGREVLKEIKDDPSLSAIPVVVLTSSEAEKDLAQAYDLAANAYVVKPVNYQSYIDMLQNINSFWINTAALPTAKKTAEKKTTPSAEVCDKEQNGETIHLLIVEDSPGDRLLYRTYLEGDDTHTYLFSDAASGQEALAMCRSMRPDCVLLDYYLPDIDGAEVLEQLMREHKHLPVVALTGKGSAELAVNMMRKGAQDYLSKDTITPAILQHAVHNAIERGSMLRQIDRSNRELMEAKEKAEIATRAKSDFLANISHELRTPMNAVVGITHILKTASPLPGRQQELVNTLDESAQSLLELINNLLDLSRTESGTIQLEKKEFSLAKLVEKSLTIMQVKAGEKNLTLTAEIAPEAKQKFLGDKLRIQQVLNNLLSNAIKFTSDGSVRVRVSAKAHAKRNRADVEVAVSDSGIGIAPERLPLIFRKFTQADPSIFRKYGGSGLGLAICKQLVEAMGGSIEVESEQGKGATFTLRLPLGLAPSQTAVRGKKAARTTRDASETAASEKAEILLVEDYRPNVLVATVLLEGLGFRCDVAYSGREAVDKVSHRHYDLVLMDVQMEDMDGMEATRRIRALERQKSNGHTPIIAMTANAFVGAMQECLDAGMDDYISKPFSPDDLQEKLDKFLHAA